MFAPATHPIIRRRAPARPSRDRTARRSAFASALVLGAVASLHAAHATDEATTRDLTPEQNTIFSVAVPPPPPSIPTAQRLNVTAWVDHADNTYAIGEEVRLYVRPNKQAYITIINIGPTGNKTLLYPMRHQAWTPVGAGQIVEIPSHDSGVSIRVNGPVGRELIKVIASTSPERLLEETELSGTGPFSVIGREASSLARDLQVTMNHRASHEWDVYNKVITTIGGRPTAGGAFGSGPVAPPWPEPNHGLRLATNKSYYRSGEPITLHLRADAPCYLTLVNTSSDGQTRVLLPNAMQPQNQLPGGQAVIFPGVGSNLRLTSYGPPGMETITAICRDDNVPVFGGGFSYDSSGFAPLDPRVASVARDLSVVTTTPSGRVAHATVGYLVTQ